MTDLRDSLQNSLGAAYVIERELGGGGMSRVFVAQETALGRTVVIKVLPPELGVELSADRFAREIKVAAQLQDPHIVPVLSAGDAGGLPYYTMPYVAGDSLRDRLRRDPKPPMAEAVEVLRGMLLALAAAHDAGVVHRDIKPENVLLTRAGTPVVADFGIAKAVAASRTQAGDRAPATEALTQHGLSIGTPAYMSPEQAAGGTVDHRADLYAWGMVAYELLSGAHPFAAKTNARQLIAAQLMERPAPLASRAANIPPPLVTLVERAIAKAPDDRPAGAREMLRALDAATGRNTGGEIVATAFRLRRTLMVSAGIVAAVAAGIIVMARTHGAAAAQLSPARVVVLPFDNRTGDSALAPLGAMAADWITRGLSETGLVDVAAVTTSGAASDTRLATSRAARAGTLLAGTIYRAGDSVRIVATITDVSAGRVMTSLDPVMASAADPLAGLETLRRRVAGALAQRIDPGFDPDRLQGTPPSFEAYRTLLDARQSATVLKSDRLAHAASLYRRAESIDTGYVQPVLEEAGVQLNLRDFARVDTLFAWLERRRVRLTPYEAASLDTRIALRRRDLPGAAEAARRLTELAPKSASAQMALAGSLRALNRAHEADSVLSRVDTARVGIGRGFWLLRAFVARQLGDHRRELGYMDVVLRSEPDNGNNIGWRIRALASLGRTDEVRAIAERVGSGPRANRQDEILGAAVVGLLSAGHAGDARAVAGIFAQRRLAAPPVAFDDDPGVSMYTVAALDFSGRHAEAMRMVDSLIASLSGHRGFLLDVGIQNDYPVWLVSLKGAMLARTGDTAAADAVDRQLQALRPAGIALASALVGRAAIAAQLGRREAAVARLREAIDAGSTFAFTSAGSNIFINSGISHDSPWLAPLVGYAPFEALMRPGN